MGHGRNYVPTDVISRDHRMLGEVVLRPMGWDAFGLPAENEAIKRGVHPQETTTHYAANYRRQMTRIGCSYDWEREINSSSSDFYRWTQAIFLLLCLRGLAYRGDGAPVVVPRLPDRTTRKRESARRLLQSPGVDAEHKVRRKPPGGAKAAYFCYECPVPA